MSSSIALKPAGSENQEFLEVKSVSLEWKLSNLKHIFDTSKGEAKSKCVKSVFFGDGKWQVFFYPNSGHDQYCSLYLSCQPTSEEIEKGSIQIPTPTPNTSHPKSIDPAQVPWHREGLFKFTFEIKSLDRRTTYKTMEANDHAFSHEARNWGWAQYWRRNDAYYSNPSAKYNDAFLVCCTIVYSPSPPINIPPAQALKRSIPLDLLQAYSSLFNDPTYADVVFHIRRPSRKLKKLYASKKILVRRSEYFGDMFDSGFAESSKLNQGERFSSSEEVLEGEEEQEETDELMGEDSDDEDSEEDLDEGISNESSSVRLPVELERVPSGVGSLDVSPPEVPPSPRRDECAMTPDGQTDESVTWISRMASTLKPESFASTTTTTTTSTKVTARQRSRAKDLTATQPRTIVEVTDAAYTTYKALLYFLYTDSITFAPLTSTYECLKDAAESNGQKFEYESRKAFVQATVSINNNQPENVICSAKAIYRLADKLNLVELKSRAYDHITRSLTVQNIPMEVFSAFTNAFEEIRKVEIEFMLSNWNELRDGKTLYKVLKFMPNFSEIWSLILIQLEHRPKSLNHSNINGNNNNGNGFGQMIDGVSSSEGHRSIDAA
ncbi:hypothetical protein CROQUDRAFT_107077 [Cronartium quercuum f. sp. fusiforme G11]|uniref:MATH domain-containing protein n=1 Tax=Cronartium quercuum f. sp. fusiforme G11 TaxID=708437 RepID=A0A9P6NGM9_9BASI|nr:hypothetical protein CROQUDRAFT_107077 [Cronartium quercuum f. sp. fusiforme G11]